MNRAHRILRRKSVTELQQEFRQHGLRRSLSALNIVLLGIGCIIGAGVFVMTGIAAANFAGPAVLLSFVIAGIACALTALCYAELASAIPVAGSSYTYCYAALGEVFAWALGWILIFDYGLAEALVAAGFAGYLTSLLAELGITVPGVMATPWLQSQITAEGISFAATGGLNLVALLAILTATFLLTRGISTSMSVNNLLVFVKVSVLLVFVVVGSGAIDTDNWIPFIPPNEGGFAYGWEGVMRGASMLFFAYLGFETIATAASEARNPQRDMPIGILGALGVCTCLYLAVAAVLTGIVPYRELSTPDPIAVAIDRIGLPSLSLIVKIGAVAGLGSVLLINAYGQSRICYSIARDGLLPRAFHTLHPRYATPHAGLWILGAVSALGAAFLPIAILGDLISIGTGFAFSIVCLSVIWLRTTHPDLPRPFRVPFGGAWIGRVWFGVVPVAGIIMCWTMILPVVIDIVSQAARGHALPAIILGGYLLLGALIYIFYGTRSSAPCAS